MYLLLLVYYEYNTECKCATCAYYQHSNGLKCVTGQFSDGRNADRQFVKQVFHQQTFCRIAMPPKYIFAA